MTEDKYRNESQQRGYRVLLALAGHEVNGIAPGDIAKGLRISASNATRDLANLRIAGLAEELEPGRWRLSPRVPQIAVAMLNGIDRSQSKVDEVRQRFTRVR